MRGVYSVLFLLSLLSWALATPEWDAVRAAHERAIANRDAIRQRNQEAEANGEAGCEEEPQVDDEVIPGRRYWLYELWPARGDPTDCISGYGHAVLVAGTRTGTPEEPGDHFVARSFDLVLPDWQRGQPYDGQTVMRDRDDFAIRAGYANTYQWIGRATRTDLSIWRRAGVYVGAHGNYLTSGNNAVNCRTFVEDITGVPVVDNPGTNRDAATPPPPSNPSGPEDDPDAEMESDEDGPASKRELEAVFKRAAAMHLRRVA